MSGLYARRADGSIGWRTVNYEVEMPESRAPFSPQPADLGGCGKPAVIGCLAVLVVLAVGLVVFVIKARDMLDWALLRYQEAIAANLSEEVTEEERRRLERAFEGARSAIRDNRMDPSALQKLQRFMSSPPQSDQRIGPETVRELTEVLESIARARSKLPEAEPELPRSAGIFAMAGHVGV